MCTTGLIKLKRHKGAMCPTTPTPIGSSIPHHIIFRNLCQAQQLNQTAASICQPSLCDVTHGHTHKGCCSVLMGDALSVTARVSNAHSTSPSTTTQIRVFCVHRSHHMYVALYILQDMTNTKIMRKSHHI